ILMAMKRGHTALEYKATIRALRRIRPNMSLSSDIIVGFPGETEEDFEETVSLCREVRFQNAFIFKYSPRKDTPAAKMPDQLPEKLIEERHAHLLSVVDEIRTPHYQDFVGQQVQILAEGPSRKNPATLEGRTRCNKIVIFEGAQRHIGQLLDVKITSASSTTLYGDPAVLNLDE
ncbi:MAG: TRAM domain-containing protein, partial [Limisphaerales bacterium]